MKSPLGGRGGRPADGRHKHIHLEGRGQDGVGGEQASAAGVSYRYDGDGKRVEKVGSEIYWYGLGSEPLMETDWSGNLENEYVFLGGKRIARRDASGNVYYYLGDDLGTSRVIATSSGTKCYDADFGPYGQEDAYLNTCPQNYKFTGKERDPETGNDYFGARYYENNLGRFMTADPLPWIGWQHGNDYQRRQFVAYLENPQHFDEYAYALNNPVTLTDPTGMNACGGSNDSACHVTVTLQSRSTDAKGNYSDQFSKVRNEGQYNATATVRVNGKVVGVFLAKTTPTDGGKYPTVANGTYSGTLTEHDGHYAIRLQPTSRIPIINGSNPAHPSEGRFAQGILVHISAANNLTGMVHNGLGQLVPDSMGCTVVCSSQYPSFERVTGMGPVAGPPQKAFTVVLDTQQNQ